MTTDELIGQQLDGYLLLSVLGQGGMARVYRAMDVRLKRYVALKVIDAPFRTDSEYTRRFEREAQAIAQLEHPHIVTLYRYGQSDGLLYMAMQYVEGSDLQAVLARYQAENDLIHPAEAINIIRDLCLALDYAHSKGVIHRDIKPSNVILDSQGEAILADFGLVLLTDVGTRGEVFGTPHYISPEQAISSASAGPQSDLYAVGVILYEMCTGALPFDGDDSIEIAMRHMNEAPRPPRELRPELSREVEAVILQALQKNPEDRFANGAALADALEQAWLPVVKGAPPPVAHHSILQRVAMNMAVNPLPPLPAAIAAPAAATNAPVTMPLPEPKATPGASPNRTAPLLLVGAGAVVFMLLIFCLAAGFLVTRLRDGSEVVAGGATAASEENISGEGGVSGVEEMTGYRIWLPVIFSSPQVDTMIPEDSVAETAVRLYTLLIVKEDKDLFVINQTTAAFPLTPLQINVDNGNKVLDQWGGMTFLQPNACLLVRKDRNQSGGRLPQACHSQAGDRLVFDWSDKFELYFAGQAVAACDVQEDVCAVTISVDEQ